MLVWVLRFAVEKGGKGSFALNLECSAPWLDVHSLKGFALSVAETSTTSGPLARHGGGKGPEGTSFKSPARRSSGRMGMWEGRLVWTGGEVQAPLLRRYALVDRPGMQSCLRRTCRIVLAQYPYGGQKATASPAKRHHSARGSYAPYSSKTWRC